MNEDFNEDFKKKFPNAELSFPLPSRSKPSYKINWKCSNALPIKVLPPWCKRKWKNCLTVDSRSKDIEWLWALLIGGAIYVGIAGTAAAPLVLGVGVVYGVGCLFGTDDYLNKKFDISESINIVKKKEEKKEWHL